VADLAAHAALSPRQFTRQFRARTGTSPHQWLLTQRLGLACRLLETTDQSVTSVALGVGYFVLNASSLFELPRQLEAGLPVHRHRACSWPARSP